MSRRPWALPLVPLYAAALALKDALRRGGLLDVQTLRWPVVSVGSLSAGGAGKTPVVIALANMLQTRGWHVDVLTRGYKREGGGNELVDLRDPDAAARFGDEPVLIAERTGAPVFVGADRFVSGMDAEDCEPMRIRKVHLLDDGFQHRRLARTLDIVLLTEEDLDDALIPAGNLREPLKALLHAGVVVIREDERDAIEERLQPLLAEHTPLWSIRRTLRFPAPLGVLGAGLRPVAFCAIARPEDFASMLVEAGCGVAETIAFADHAAADVDKILEVAHSLNATGLITTEKDAVKLSEAQRARLAAIGPLVVVALEVSFLYPERVARELEARLA